MTAAELTALYPVLAKLPAALLQRVAAALQTVAVPAGTVVFDEHQPCGGFPFVLAGAVRVAEHRGGLVAVDQLIGAARHDRGIGRRIR